jgi:5'-nucleotidase / UDP-sugar diphosphatase
MENVMARVSRRGFLTWLGAAGAGSLLPAGSPAREQRDLVRISVLHTTDLHGHILPTSSYEGEENLGGLARCATQIRRWKEENPECILVDAGDVYQGTDIGWRTRGKIMAGCFNALGYDGWVIGNHEFDWGVGPLAGVIGAASAPALCANALVGGKPTGSLDPSHSPLAGIRPCLLKDVGGFKVGIVGLTTPGLPFWFPPSFTEGFEVRDPAEDARRHAEALRAGGADAVILVTHMGMRPQGDDHANRLESVAKAVPDAALIVAGHTHRDTPEARVGGIPYTQAAYHGLHAGRTDLLFDPVSRHLLAVEPRTVRMTSEIPADPVIMSLAQHDLEESARALATPAGRIAETLSTTGPSPMASDIERLIGSAIAEGLAERGTHVDAVLHGSFSREDLAAGPKTVGDFWRVIPYENFVITGEFDIGDLRAVIEETGRGASARRLVGIRPKYAETGNPPEIAAFEDRDGKPLRPGKRHRIAMNTYDASSGGNRFPRLREIMRSAAARAVIHPVQTREALIAFVAKRGEDGVTRADLLPA